MSFSIQHAVRVSLICLALVGLEDAYSQDGAPDSVPTETLSANEAKPQPDTSSLVSSPADRRTFLQYLVLSGVCGVLIVVCSVIATALVIEHALTIRRGVLMPDDVIDELEELIRTGRLDAAIETCQARPCLFTNVVLAGLERYRASEFGFAEYRAAAEEAGEEQTARLYRKTEGLNVIGAISPMLGLTGTVLGMIKAFNVIAASGGAARPEQLAGGISEALITTLMGLFVAIPTMVFFSYFRNKIDSLVAEAGKRVEQVLMPLGRRSR